MKRIVIDRDGCSDAEVGGKFSRQAAMAAAGIETPRFYCLTTAYYEQATAPLAPEVRARCAQIDWDDAESVRAASRDILARFETLQLSSAQEAEILAPFERLFAADTKVSVRGSMVGYRAEESEDSAGHAFAGMSESFLFVPQSHVLERVRQVWASGFSQEALLYRHANGMDLLGFAVAVGVQQMVAAERSFVLFTCNPQNAAREAVVVATYGLGEGVVQEKVPCDHYFVRPDGEIQRELACKDQRLVLDAAKGRGLISEPVPEDLREVSCLQDEQLESLARLGAKIEALFGAPQDIEGALVGDQVYILQARPIQLDYSRQRVFSNANITESFPGVSSPLTFSMALFFYRVIFHDGHRVSGIPRRELADHGDQYLSRKLGYIDGRVYYNLTSFYVLQRINPLFFIAEKDWRRMLALPVGYETGTQERRDWLAGKLRFLRYLWVEARCVLFHKRRQRRFYRWWEELFAGLRGRSFRGEEPLHTIDTFWRVWREVGEEWGVTLKNDTYLPMLFGIAVASLKKYGLEEQDPALLSDLLCGDEEIVSVEIILSAVRLAEFVCADPELKEAFQTQSPDELWTALSAGEFSVALAEAVRLHLHRYGDRGLQELKLEQPSLRHDPSILIRSVQSYVDSGVTVASLEQDETRRRADAEVRLSKNLGGLRALWIRWLAKRIRGLLRYRENSRYCRSELFGFTREVFLALGHHLQEHDELEAERDVFFLTQDELIGAIDGTCVTRNLKALVELRRAEVEENRGREVREQVTTLGAVRLNDFARRPTKLAGNELAGLGSSPGRVEGTARLVLDPSAPIEPADDMILVARETDPGWMFLMLACKGMVVERGSMLSHTAITGRKFGIPTVVAVPDATLRIPDGARILVDGALGTVTLLDFPPDPETEEAPEEPAP
ncbi:MAG: phosphoenolpyruvate synthase [Planctomycetes bacterium]|nr:phosphoenolpyruvate synthase [Planctomycetota bacterium]